MHKLAVALHFGVHNFVRNDHGLGTTVVEMTADYMRRKEGEKS